MDVPSVAGCGMRDPAMRYSDNPLQPSWFGLRLLSGSRIPDPGSRTSDLCNHYVGDSLEV